MGFIFEPFSESCCCLCGATENLSGEHKIKASELRAIFGSEAMMMGHFDGITEPRAAQGPKSRVFHFSARLCGNCNSTRTQPADEEFVRFHRQAAMLLDAGRDPAEVIQGKRYQIGSGPYLNVFRYFAKLMACHIAESRGPRSHNIARFSIGATDVNPILLFVDRDPTYEQYLAVAGDHSYAAHGGLVVKIDPKTELLTCFHTTLTLGPVRYGFRVEFSPIVSIALRLFHREFFERCQLAYQQALEHPMSPEKLNQLGL